MMMISQCFVLYYRHAISALTVKKNSDQSALLTLHAGITFFLFFFCCLLIFFSRLTFSKISFRNMIRMSNSLDPDLARHFVVPDLGPNCLQRLSADYKSH